MGEHILMSCQHTEMGTGTCTYAGSQRSEQVPSETSSHAAKQVLTVEPDLYSVLHFYALKIP